MQKWRAVVGGIREDRVEFFHAPAFNAENLGRFCNGIVTLREGLPNSSGDADEIVKLVGEILSSGRREIVMAGTMSFGLALPRESIMSDWGPRGPWRDRAVC